MILINLHMIPDMFPFIELLTVGREFAEVVQAVEHTGGQGQQEGGHQQPVDSLHTELSLTPLLQAEESTRLLIRQGQLARHTG